jgi:hypothetical protein
MEYYFPSSLAKWQPGISLAKEKMESKWKRLNFAFCITIGNYHLLDSPMHLKYYATIMSQRRDFHGIFLQKSLTTTIPANPGSGPGQAPEPRIARRCWIPGRASLARNDDFLLL